MKKIATLLLILCMALPAYAQINTVGRDDALATLQNQKIDMEQRYASFNLSKEEISRMEGSPYVNESFIQGNIYNGKELASKNVLLRYNAYSDEIEIKKSKQSETFNALIKDPDIYVKIFNDIYVFVPFKGSNKKGGYFNIVTEGNQFDLYKKTKVTYKEPYYAQTSYQKDRPAKWVKETTYYLVGKDGSFYEIPNRRSKVVDLMDEKKKEIKRFVKEQNIDFDNERDLSKLVTYFNSIL